MVKKLKIQMLKKAMASMLAVAMVVTYIPTTHIKAEDNTPQYDTGLYGGECFCEGDDYAVNYLFSNSFSGIGNQFEMVPIFATKSEATTTYEYVAPEDLQLGYNSEIIDPNKEEQYTFTNISFDGYFEEHIPTEEEYDRGWFQREAKADKYFGEGETVPVRYFRVIKTGSYKFSYRKNDKTYSFFYIVNHRGYEFYDTNNLQNDTLPLGEYFYESFDNLNDIYLVKGEDTNVYLGKLKYNNDGSVVMNGDNPVLESEGSDFVAGTNFLKAGRFEWNDEARANELTENCSDYISYNKSTGEITLEEDIERNQDYQIAVYYYTKNINYRWNEEKQQNVEEVEYRQEDAMLRIFHGLDFNKTIRVGYDEWNGTVYIQKAGDEEAVVAESWEGFMGEDGALYDFYLIEKPKMPENFDWDNATQEEIDSYGNRGGSEPVVFVRTDRGGYAYRVGDEEFAIDDCDDEDENTWHFSYTYHSGDELQVYWSEYDSFEYNPEEEFQIEMDSPENIRGGAIEISPESEITYADERFGVKYNYQADAADGITIKFIPDDGFVLRNFRIGEVRYENLEYIYEGFEESEYEKVFEADEDGSYTFTLSKDDVVGRWYDNEKEQWVIDTNWDGSPRYARLRVEAFFEEDWQYEEGYYFSYNVYPETWENYCEGVEAFAFKINDNDWNYIDAYNDDLGLYEKIEPGDVVTLKYIFKDGYNISPTDLKVTVDSGEFGRNEIQIRDKQAVIEALTSEDGCSFSFMSDEGMVPIECDSNSNDAYIALQFHVMKEYANKSTVNVFVQGEAGTSEDGTVINGEVIEEAGQDRIIDAIYHTEPMLLMFNNNPYGGWDDGATGEVENDGVEPISISYYSNIPGENYDKKVTITPTRFLSFEVGADDDKNEICIENYCIDELYVDFNNDGFFDREEQIEPERDEDEYIIQGCYRFTVDAADSYNIFIRTHIDKTRSIEWYYGDGRNDVKNGKIYLKQFVRNGHVYVGNPETDKDGNIICGEEGVKYGIFEEFDGFVGNNNYGGYISCRVGDELTFVFVPDKGYKLASNVIDGQVFEKQADESYLLVVDGRVYMHNIFVEDPDYVEEPTTVEQPTEKPTEKTTEKPTEKVTQKPTEKPTVAPTTKAPEVKVGKTKITSAKRKAKKLTLKLKAVKGASGYEIWYSTTKKFTKSKTKKVTASSTKKVIKRLKVGKKYYVKARAFVKTSAGTKNGKWTKVTVTKKK